MEALDLREKGGVKAGEQQTSDQRLFMQFMAFSGRIDGLVASLEATKFGAVVYEDVNDPQGLGLLTWSADPDHFVSNVRPVLQGLPLVLKPEYTMLGRTYALGHEPNLEDWLMHRSPRSVTDPSWLWHVW